MPDAAPTAAAKASALLRRLETYVFVEDDWVIDDATARRNDEPFSVATTEGMVQLPLHRRMRANQQMRRASRGAHCMLKVRGAVARRPSRPPA